MSLVKWAFIGLLVLPAAEIVAFILVAALIGWLLGGDSFRRHLGRGRDVAPAVRTRRPRPLARRLRPGRASGAAPGDPRRGHHARGNSSGISGIYNGPRWARRCSCRRFAGGRRQSSQRWRAAAGAAPATITSSTSSPANGIKSRIGGATGRASPSDGAQARSVTSLSAAAPVLATPPTAADASGER